MGFEILIPPFDWDLGRRGQVVRRPDWASGPATTPSAPLAKLEMTASAHDRDYAIAVNWKAAEQAAADGEGQA